MSEEQPNNPLHGITLEAMLTRLVEHYGWEGLARRITINCFTFDPSIKSSLTFIRRTPWARIKLENLYLRTRFKAPKNPVPSAKTKAPKTSSPETPDSLPS